MNLETILVELKEKRRALETAISALEALQRRYRQKGTRTQPRRKRVSAPAKNKTLISDAWTKPAVGANNGELIPFPAVSRRVRAGRNS